MIARQAAVVFSHEYIICINTTSGRVQGLKLRYGIDSENP